MRQYRADLDGMRAVAVLSVLAYHLDHRLLPGGFVGVDIFFVLSGFFITQLLAHDLTQSKFSILNFYDRRIRRLLPALFVMLAATSLAAMYILMPHDLERYGRHLIGAVLSVSNIVFWQDSGYFAPDAETFPLLHTWSLAVEEQFYLLYPVTLWLVWRYARRWLKHAMIAAFCLSFAVSLIASFSTPTAAFYLAPSRAWELAGGALLALGVFAAPRRDMTRQVAYALGLGLVGLSLVVIDKSQVFPGFGALLPCTGTMLVIWAGLNSANAPARTGFGVDNLLTLRPVVWIGLISYSLYLWHWPVIVLARHASIGELTAFQKLLLVPMMTLLAILSWRFVEQPFRAARTVWPTRTRRFAYSGAAASVIVLAGASTTLADGYPERLPDRAMKLDLASEDFSPIRAECHVLGFQPGETRPWCQFGPESGWPVYLYSDSHGAELGYVLSERADALGLRFTPLTSSACPPVVGYRDQESLNCQLNNEQTLQRLTGAPAGTVILTAHFYRFANEAPDFWKGFEATVTQLRDAGHRVIILGALPPDPDGAVPTILAKSVYRGFQPDAYAFPFDTGRMERIDTELRDISARTGAEYIALRREVCGAPDRCFGMRDGRVIYFDDHHLSVSMAEKVVDDLLQPSLSPEW